MNVPSAKMRHLLERVASERRGVLVDAGGLRGVRRPIPGSGGKQMLAIEKYIVLEDPPPIAELLGK